MPVGEEDGALDAGVDEILDLTHADEAGAEMDLAADLEADVMSQRRAGLDELREVGAREHFLEIASDESKLVGHRTVGYRGRLRGDRSTRWVATRSSTIST